LTTHRCFGSLCPSDENLVQVDESKEMPHAYGNFHEERDLAAGYPKEYNADKDMVKMIKAHIQGETGAFVTPFEVQNRYDEELEKKLNETAQKPAFKVNDRMIDDWPGTRFTTTHACFGKPCEKSLVQDQLDKGDYTIGTYKIGDVQEHKYGY